jgi:hypothetical protein
MSELVSFPAARRTARANLAAAWLEGGALQIYSADQPVDADQPIDAQTLLAVFTLPDPIGAVEDGVLTGAAIDPAMIAADGGAAWARAVDSQGATVADFSVGLDGSGHAVILDNLSLVTGAVVTLTSFVYAEG